MGLLSLIFILVYCVVIPIESQAFYVIDRLKHFLTSLDLLFVRHETPSRRLKAVNLTLLHFP